MHNLKSFVLAAAVVVAFNTHADICATLESAIKTGTPEQKLNKFFDGQWTYNMIEHPEWATYVGFSGQNDRWSDLSFETIERHKREDVCQLNVLKKIPSAGLKGEDKLNFELMKRHFERAIEGQKFPSEYLAVDQLGGVYSEVPDMMLAMPAITKADYENILARLEKVPTLVSQNETLLREGLKRHITGVKFLLEKVPGQIDKLLTKKVEDSALYHPFAEMNPMLPEAEKSALRARAKQIIEAQVFPSFREFKDFVAKEYIPGCRENIAFSDMPDGKAWYAYRVRTETTTNMTPDQLHELGLREVARIKGEMEKIKDQVEFKGDLNAFNKYLLTEKRFYYDDPEKLLVGFRDIAKRIDPELPKVFRTLPRLTYGVRAMPAFKAADAPGAYYEGGSMEAGRPGYFTANTSDLPGRPKWGMEALTLHEAVPGHHFQIAMAQELKGLPEFRRHGDHSTAFVEGWGLYAESLGDELGLYKDPYSKYGQLSYEIWRAIRLVVDTGIHAKGWTRQQAIDYFANAMPKARKETENEVDRYITWPGQALAYKVGQLKFLELKARAKQELGERFIERDFHDQLLKHGALPMDVLERTIAGWIDTEKKKSNKKLKTKV